MSLYKRLVLTATLLGLFTWQIETKRYGIPCLDAGVCKHTKVRLCGLVKKTGEVRWFLDKCDILEFNCEYKTKFVKTKKSRCKHVPPL